MADTVTTAGVPSDAPPLFGKLKAARQGRPAGASTALNRIASGTA